MGDHDNWAGPEQGAAAVSTGCIVDGHTLVDTPAGAVPAASLGVGDIVVTFDDGPRRLRSVERRPATGAGRMVLVPAGLIGNAEELLVMPDQRVIVESDVAEELTGSPFAVVPASALEAAEGVRRTRAARARNLVSLAFVEDQAVTVAGGAVLVADGAAGMPCLLRASAARYDPLDPVFVPEVVAALEEASWEMGFAATA